MKVVFCGNIVPVSYDTKLKYLSPAGNRFQINMCREIEKQGHELTILSYLGFPMEVDESNFHQEKYFFPDKIHYVTKKKGVVQSIREYQKLMDQMLENADVVISYNIIYAWLKLPSLSKRRNVKSILVWADYTDKSSYKKILQKFYASIQLFCAKKYMYVVGLSRNIERLLSTNQDFLCMEGGISNEFFDEFDTFNQCDGQISFMYSGLLESVTGIDLLLEAFMNTDIDAKLLISGKGSLDQEVIKYSQLDNRIEYLGYLEYEQYMKKLKEVDVLVNPRNMNLEENQNNFPSKIMEYLATGKLILSTKFIGYETFDENITFAESSIESLRMQIERTCNECRNIAPKLYEINREKAKNYLWEKQINNLLKWVEGTNDCR